MQTAVMVLGLLFSLVGAVGGIWILIEAFKVSVAEGFLTLCVPCYVFYFVFAKLDHPQKGLIVTLWLGGSIMGGILQGVAQSLATGHGM